MEFSGADTTVVLFWIEHFFSSIQRLVRGIIHCLSYSEEIIVLLLTKQDEKPIKKQAGTVSAPAIKYKWPETLEKPVEFAKAAEVSPHVLGYPPRTFQLNPLQ